MKKDNSNNNPSNDLSTVELNPMTWVPEHGDILYRYALARLRNPELAANAVQETFLAALKAKKRFKGKSTERTWMVGILKHKIIDEFRKRYHEIAVTDLESNDDETALNSFFDNTGRPYKYPSEWEDNSDSLLYKNEFWSTVESCIKKLPPRTAEAFSLREMDGLQTEEICKILNISMTNLWVMLHRARLQLRTCIEKNWFDKK
jgi:RNA polymerase sigma-70 factor (ECF subfamily)